MNKAFLLFLLGVAACAKTQVAPAPKPTPRTVSWRVESRELTTDRWVSGRSPDGTRSVIGREYVGDRLVSEVELAFPAAVGTHPFGATSPGWARYSREGVRYYAGTVPGRGAPVGSGTVVLTAAQDGVAVGTFTFTGIDPVSQAEKTVTHGTFRVSI